jgi:polyisoprenoid-binding protein YceI
MGVPILPSATSALLAALLLLASGHQVDAGDTTYAVDAGKSSVVVHVGKEGIFSFAGHEHVVTAPRLQGKVLAAPDDLSRCRVTLTFETAALRVQEKGEPKGDAAKVQEAMLGPQVLDAKRHPSVTFKSRTVTGKTAAQGTYDLTIRGDLSLHGVTRSVALPLRVEVGGDALKASGRLVLRQTEYGIKPLSVGGVVKVKDALTIDYAIVATKANR